MPTQKLPSTRVPTLEQIETALESFQPRPGKHFYRRLAAAPWAQTSHPVSQGEFFMKSLNTKRLRPLALAISTLILIIGILSTPWGQAIAAEVLGLFIHKNDDVLAISPEEATRAANPPVEIEQPTLQYASASLAVEDATAKLGFDVKEPSVMDPDFGFRDAIIAYEGISLIYDYWRGGRQLVIFQQLMTDSNSTATVVGASAVIEEVQIGEVKGEYVEGQFIVLPGATAAIWKSDVPFRRVRWVNNGVLFEIIAAGGGADEPDLGYIGKAELIAIAEGLK